MQIVQKKFSNIHTFSFEDQHLNFAYKDRSGSGDTDIAYANLPLKSSIRIEENTWWRNAGYIWCVIGILDISYGASIDASMSGRGFWLVVGLICLAIFKITRVQYTVFTTGAGGIFVIQDGKTHDKIIEEIKKRRKNQLLKFYGEIDIESDLEKETAKFNYLQEQEALTKEEAAAKILEARLAYGSKPDENPRVLN